MGIDSEGSLFAHLNGKSALKPADTVCILPVSPDCVFSLNASICRLKMKGNMSKHLPFEHCLYTAYT